MYGSVTKVVYTLLRLRKENPALLHPKVSNGIFGYEYLVVGVSFDL